ncbi:MAG: hypothetical protein ACE5FA_07350 [Dehalococcoidia bacterium]
MQQVKVTVEVNGHVVKQQVEQVDGTLEQMEEKIDAMSRNLAAAALQASVDAVTPPRPLFRRTEGSGGTRGTKLER